MARSTTGFSYLIFGLVVLGSLVFTIFVTIPKINDLNGARANRQEALDQKKEREDFLTSLEQRKAELDTYAADAKALSVALPTSFKQGDLLMELDSAASTSGVVVQKVSDSQKVKSVSTASKADSLRGGKAEYFDTDLEVRGSYAQLRAFIKELEKSILFTDITSVEITTPSDSADASSALTAKLVLRNYIQP